MANSTTTKLGLINRSLRAVGERSVTSSTVSPAAVKCADSVSDALNQLCMMQNWPFMLKEVNATSWSTYTTVLPSFVSLLSVSTDLQNGGRQYAQPEGYPNVRASQNYAWGSDNDAVLYYALQDDDQIIVRPYPDTTGRRAKVWFHIYQILALPTLDSDVFTGLPETFIPLLTSMTAQLLAGRLLNDPNTVSYFAGEVALQLAQARRKYTNRALNQPNMFRW
jgi:hypothetical protein